MNGAAPIVEDVHARGAAHRADLVHRFGRREVDRAERSGDLYGVTLLGVRIYVLDARGQRSLGLADPRTRQPASSRLVDELSGRVGIAVYEADGWTFQRRFAAHIYHFRRDGEPLDDYLIIKRDDYTPYRLDRLVRTHFSTVFRAGGRLVACVRRPLSKDLRVVHRLRLDTLPFEAVLPHAHPHVRALLEEVPV